MAGANLLSTPIQTIGDIVNIFRKAGSVYQTTSLTEVTKLSRVEPLTIVAKDCLALDYLPDIMQSLLNIFTGYYLQAVALSAKIENVKIVKVLDRLNTDRDESGYFAALESAKDIKGITLENYEWKLPRQSPSISLEASTIDPDDLPEPEFDTKENASKIVSEVANLSVGKMVDVTICSGEQKVKIPVSIRLTPATIPTQSIVHLLALKVEENTLVERFHAWRSGRIAFIKDLILCQDLIDQHKTALMNDDNGTYSEIVRRANNAKKWGLLTMNPSLVSASNIFVLSEESAKEVELKLGGKLANARIRQKAFENTYGMIICVIDRDYERVTFYFRGIAQPTEVSVKDIKQSNKSSKGPDILDIFKSLSSGQAASF